MDCILPRTRPLFDSSVKLKPSAYWVCSTVWKPMLEMITQGITVQKSEASTNPAKPTPRVIRAPAVSRCCETR